MRLGIQRVARVTQQVHDANVQDIHLLWLKIFHFVGEEGGKIDSGQRRRWRRPSSPALRNEIALSTLVVTVVHGELQHALHQNGTVPKAGTIHRPQIDVVGIGSDDNITECLIQSNPGDDIMMQGCPCSYARHNLIWLGP